MGLNESLESFFKGPGLPLQNVMREGAMFVFNIDGRSYLCCKKAGEIKVKEGKPEDYMFLITCPREQFEEILLSRDYSEFRFKWKELKVKGSVKISFPRSGADFVKKWALLGMFEALRRFGFYP
jgi:hypothetical protein